MQEGTENGGSHDVEAALDKHIAGREAERAEAAEKAIQEGKAAELAQRLERERSTAIATLESVIQQTGAHFHVLPGRLVELLRDNELEVSENGLRRLLAKFPGLANGNTTRKLVAGAPEHEPEPKPPKRSDFPSTKDGFPNGWAGAELKASFISAFGYDEWENLPATPVALKDSEKLTTAEFNRLSSSQKFEINKALIAKGDSMDRYLLRIARNS